MSPPICRWCHGTGHDNENPHYRCEDCDGTGRACEPDCAECQDDESTEPEETHS